MPASSPAAPRRRGGIPEATVARLPVYLRVLHGLAETGTATVSSESLAAAAGVGSASAPYARERNANRDSRSVAPASLRH